MYIYIYIYIYIYTESSLLGGWETSPSTSQKPYSSLPLPHEIFIPSPPKVSSTQQKNGNIIFSCSHCSCTIFVLISYYFEIQIMLILILMDVQYSQNTVFSLETFLNCQNHSTSGSHHLVKNSPQQC